MKALVKGRQIGVKARLAIFNGQTDINSVITPTSKAEVRQVITCKAISLGLSWAIATVITVALATWLSRPTGWLSLG
jgi:hypothetical protein